MKMRKYSEKRVFFYQAEDGIRYYRVTGVQTCAFRSNDTATTEIYTLSLQIGRASVGKECRSRWSPYHLLPVLMHIVHLLLDRFLPRGMQAATTGHVEELPA